MRDFDVTATGAHGSTDLELSITRIFDAPRERVFRAWTDPRMLAHWMGPRTFTASIDQLELRVGGAWRFLLTSDDGSRRLWQGGVYREIVPPERLVYTFAWEGPDGRLRHETVVTITFVEQNGKTRMDFHQARFETVESRNGHGQGWASALDRLQEFVDTV